MRILIVDDNPDDRVLLKRQLEREFPDCQLAEITGPEKLSVELTGKPGDIVITDYQIGWSNGIQILRDVKSAWPNCPVVMFTATGNEEIAVQAMKIGLSDYIPKRVANFTRLLTSIKTLMDRARSRREAAQLTQQMDSLLARLKLGVYYREPSGKVMQANEAFGKLIRRPNNGVGSNLFATLDDAAELRHLAESELASQGRFEREVRITRESGATDWLLLSETLSPRDADWVIGGTLENITERKLGEEALQEAQMVLTSASRLTTMGELVGGIVHEINQPLTIISNYASLCGEQLRRVESKHLDEVRESLRLIIDQCKHASEIVNGLRRLSQRQESHRELVPVMEIVDDAVTLFSYELDQFGAEIHVESDNSVDVVFANRVQIQQVLINLLRNACEAMIGSESPRWIRLQIATKETQVVFRIADSGPGIAPEVLPRMFDLFFTTKRRGMGVGLAVCTKIIESHGGDMDAENTDQGGLVWFSLPTSNSNSNHSNGGAARNSTTPKHAPLN